MSDAQILTEKLIKAGADRAKVIAIVDGYGDAVDWSRHSLDSIIAEVWQSDLNSGEDPDGWIINEICRQFNVEEVGEVGEDDHAHCATCDKVINLDKDKWFTDGIGTCCEADKPEILERGAASIKIELAGGVITVKHGTDGDAVLARWTANNGDWDKIWATINELKEASNE